MKTVVLTIAVLACVLGVKAQTQPRQKGLQPLQPYKLMTDSNFTGLYKGNLDSLSNRKFMPAITSPKNLMANIDHMPIGLVKNTDPNMPIKQTDKTGYTMPVAGKALPRLYNMQKQSVVVLPATR